MKFDIQPILENDKVVLHPLQEDDFEALYAVASDRKIWEQHPNKDRWKKEVFQTYFQGAMESNGAFKIIDKSSGKIVGSTRIYDYNEQDNSVLIGYTFYATEYWGKGINQSLLEKAISDIKSIGAEAEGYVVDVSDEASVRNGFQKAVSAFGKVDIVINSAGIIGPTSTKITDYSVEQFDKVYAVNLRGSFLVTKYAVAEMEKNNYGRILLIASIAGKEGNPFMAGYSATKAGVIGLVKGIAKEYAETGITINGLAPAVIKTAMNDNTSPDQLAYMTAKIPMKRLGTVQEVAAIATWIVSKEATFNTGFVFDLSGGRATY
jgi:3-oxoacyl-[acyl-carrier protein] reductase